MHMSFFVLRTRVYPVSIVKHIRTKIRQGQSERSKKMAHPLAMISTIRQAPAYSMKGPEKRSQTSSMQTPGPGAYVDTNRVGLDANVGAHRAKQSPAFSWGTSARKPAGHEHRTGGVGPGTYDVTGETGRKDAEVGSRHRRPPNAAFARSARRLNEKYKGCTSDVIGPGSYDIAPVFGAKPCNAKFRTGPAHRNVLSTKNNPGPGAYDVESGTKLRKKRGPVAVMGKTERALQRRTDAPGPGFYNSDGLTSRGGGVIGGGFGNSGDAKPQGYSFGTRPRFAGSRNMQRDQIPGPGHFDAAYSLFPEKR